MKNQRMFQLTASMFAVVALLLGGCEKKPPPIERVSGAVVSTDNIEIRYDVTGQGQPALVFVHCWTCNRGFWDGQVDHFTQRYRVVRLDLAGHGESGKGRKNYTISAFGADVAAVVDKLGLKQVVLIGHSMGGPVVAEAEKRLGDRVIGVVGVDNFYTGWEYPTGEKVAEFVKPFADNFPETTDKFVRSMFMPETDKVLVDRIAGTLAGANKDMALSAMKNLLAWYNDESEAAFQRIGKKLRAINADPKGDKKPLHESVVLIKGVGHFIAQENPAEFNRVLDGFVTEFVNNMKKK